MPPNNARYARPASGAVRRRLVAAAFGLLLPGAAPLLAQSTDAADDLAAVRQQCIATARAALQHQQSVATLEHQIDLLGRDAAGRKRGLDESRTEQANLLSTLLLIARDPPQPLAYASGTPLDRVRGDMLVQGTIPGLQAEAHALMGEIERVTVLRRDVAAKTSQLGADRSASDKDRAQLAELVARRLELTRKALPEDAGANARITRLAHDAKDLDDLIKRTDMAVDQRDKEILTHARAALPKAKAGALTLDTADPTRPRGLRAFDPPQSLLLNPTGGAIDRPFDAAGEPGEAKQGLGMAAPADGEAIAPFDGRMVFVGAFRNLGLVLIIRHGGGYHSVLAGLGRADVRLDQWVVGGEPVGAMPDAADRQAAHVLDFELRRDGRPVDPQPLLAERGPERDKVRDTLNADQGVRE